MSRPVRLVRTHADPILLPTITVDASEKWYRLFAMLPDGTVREIDFCTELDEPRFCGDESAYCDHVPNPVAVQRYALTYGYEIDPLAFEIMVGRWEIEYHSRYGEPAAVRP